MHRALPRKHSCVMA